MNRALLALDVLERDHGFGSLPMNAAELSTRHRVPLVVRARYMASTDPDFETKAADIIGLYLDPPRHAAVFCLDEKTAIQVLDRRDRVLPLSPGHVERHGFEYKRHGTLSLYAALNIQTGDVVGRTTARHTSQDFVGFLGEVVATCEPDQEIHVILDNLSGHKTKLVAAFLDEHPNVKLDFTPTYSSWLNQVELWFSKVQRDVLLRGIFTSITDLGRRQAAPGRVRGAGRLLDGPRWRRGPNTHRPSR